MLPFICIHDDAPVMNDGSLFFEFLGEGDMLFADLHKSFRGLVHRVWEYGISDVFLHLRDINDSPFCQFLKLLIVNIGPVYGQNVPLIQGSGFQHERVIGGCGSELNVRGDALVSVDDSMRLYTAFLPVCFRMTADTFEYQVGEKRDGGRSPPCSRLN